MRLLLIAICAIILCANDEFIAPPYKYEIPQNNAMFYTNEGFRAASFGNRKIARDIFYKACVLGDDLGCLALNEVNSPLNTKSTSINIDECAFGDAQACFYLYKYYTNEFSYDNFKALWYLSKSCRLGNTQACNIQKSYISPPLNSNIQILNKHCFYGNPHSCYELADIYLFGRNIKRNITFAKNLLKKSCEAGLQKACTKYIKILSQG